MYHFITMHLTVFHDYGVCGVEVGGVMVNEHQNVNDNNEMHLRIFVFQCLLDT